VQIGYLFMEIISGNVSDHSVRNPASSSLLSTNISVILPVILHIHEALVLTLRENYTNRF